MTKIVFDASALLALINQEPGYEIAAEALPEAVMSAVNVSEVVTILKNIGMSLEEASSLVMELLGTIIPFNIEQAITTADLREQTKDKGLSLGDRACLALALLSHAPVLTADKIWKDIKIGGLEIRLIR